MVDSTVARLARWLRFLGYDAVLDRSDSDSKLVARARREGRVLLTRKRTLGSDSAAASPGGALLLSSDFVPEQLAHAAPRAEVHCLQRRALACSPRSGRRPGA
jgi:uncharacterized protein with PIN domain